LAFAPSAASAQRTPLGALQAIGEVLVNNAPVEGDSTVFIGDTVRTGPTGAASITMAGRGRLILAARTEIVLSGAPRYLVSLEVGTLGLNAQAEAQNFQIRVGNFLVVPSPEAAATAEIERAADGSARITCMAGSIGVIALEGEEVVFLRAGQSARISATGVFSISTPSTPAPPPEQPQPQAKRRVSAGVIVLIVGAGGAAGAAAALAGKKDKAQPLSPSQP
jgi:ferric-dicitrate binding protein FerR (iron transport regulator)